MAPKSKAIASNTLCKRCDSPIPIGKTQCIECGAWQWANSVADDGVDGSVLLEDIKSANVDRITTGAWDRCFGWVENDDGSEGPPGIVRGSTNLIGGSPGAGKSTLFLQIAMGVILNYDLPVLYLSAEEQLPQIRARADRLKINGRRKLRFVDLRSGTANVGAVLRRYQYGMIILDSLKALAETDEGCIEICKIVKEFASAQHAPALISQHVTKDMALAGLMSLQHEVDATMTFFPDTDRIGEDGEAVRVLEVIKNRNGRAFVDVEFEMTKRGLAQLVEEEEDEEND